MNGKENQEGKCRGKLLVIRYAILHHVSLCVSFWYMQELLFQICIQLILIYSTFSQRFFFSYNYLFYFLCQYFQNWSLQAGDFDNI